MRGRRRWSGGTERRAGARQGRLAIDPLHRTDTPTVFAAGDVCAEQPYIAGAIAAGSQAAMVVVQSLLAEEFGLPYSSR